MSDKRLVYVLQLERELSVAPISNWPDGYADWIPTIMSDLKYAREKRKAGELESIRKKANR